MMWVNVWAVIRREYLQRVRSKWFVAATVGGPLFLSAMIVVPAYFASQGSRDAREVAVVDGTGVLYERLAPQLAEGGWDVREERWRVNVVTELREAADNNLLGGFLLLDELTLETGEAILYTKDRPSAIRQVTLRSTISLAALEYQLEQQGVDADAMLSGGELRIEMLSEEGADIEDPEFVVAYMGAFLLYMVIMLYAVAVMRATLEEKTNRIVEVIISSMKPWHLMLGKILGVGAVSMTQMGIWLLSGVLMFTMGLPMLISARPEMASMAEAIEFLPGFGLLALFVGYFVFGFFMYSALYAAVGAMCNSDEEAQQAQWPIIMLLIIPIVMVTNVIENPSSTIAITLSLVPLFSPILMWGRVAGGGVPAWQIGLSFVLMLFAIFAIAWVAGRIYKVGILMAGKRPTLPELLRWIREA
ncbi:MAG: ABC transporter permease [Longimicrobiales bacterium]|nr:ABC transporter permease [Longimicrobiales bacterium]